MTVKNLEDLREIKELAKRNMSARRLHDARVIVHMGKSGTEADRRSVMAEILKEIAKLGLWDVSVLQAGDAEDCEPGPAVEIVSRGDGRATYRGVKPEEVAGIISERLAGGPGAAS
jgi:(2Fe-2S) ferredoxin